MRVSALAFEQGFRLVAKPDTAEIDIELTLPATVTTRARSPDHWTPNKHANRMSGSAKHGFRYDAYLALFNAVVTGEDAPIIPETLAGLGIGIDRSFCFAGTDAEVAALERYLMESGAPVGFETMLASVSADAARELAQVGLRGAPSAIPDEVYAAARDVERPALQRAMAAWFADHRIDAMLLPVTMAPATATGDDAYVDISGRNVPFATGMASNISPGSTLSLLSLVLPCALTEGGPPVAIGLDGPAGSDRRLLASCMAVESVLGVLPGPQTM